MGGLPASTIRTFPTVNVGGVVEKRGQSVESWPCRDNTSELYVAPQQVFREVFDDAYGRKEDTKRSLSFEHSRSHGHDVKPGCDPACPVEESFGVLLKDVHWHHAVCQCFCLLAEQTVHCRPLQIVCNDHIVSTA